MWWSQHQSCKNERQLEYSDLHKQTALGGNSEYGFSHNSEWCIIFLEQKHSASPPLQGNEGFHPNTALRSVHELQGQTRT